MSFTDDFNRFNNKAGNAAKDAFRAASLNISAKIIQRTPIYTGRARANWNADINVIDDSVSDATGDSVALNRVRSNVGRLEIGDTFTLTNGLPYIRKLEYGGYPQPGTDKTVGGFSALAPNGMVGITVEEFQQAVREAAARGRSN